MLMLAEQTVWSDGIKNGVYLTDDSRSKMYGFAKHGSSDFKMFKHPISLDVRGRKFLVLAKIDETPEEPEGIEVLGSKGDKYYVTETACTCSGFKYRGTCKHWEKYHG